MFPQASGPDKDLVANDHPVMTSDCVDLVRLAWRAGTSSSLTIR